MSRSAQVAWVAATILLAALAGAVVARWGVLTTWAPAVRAAVLGAGALGACLAALSIRRIVDPRLPTPVAVTVVAILVGLVVVVLWVLAIARRGARTDDGSPRSRFRSDDDRGSRGGRGASGMGLPWAIVATLLAVGLYTAAVAVIYHPPAGTTIAARPPD